MVTWRGQCFYLTYEEWKQVLEKSVLEGDNCFYLTYEEWKHVNSLYPYVMATKFLSYL